MIVARWQAFMALVQAAISICEPDVRRSAGCRRDSASCTDPQPQSIGRHTPRYPFLNSPTFIVLLVNTQVRMLGGPKVGLDMFMRLVETGSAFRVLICGGDGTGI